MKYQKIVKDLETKGKIDYPDVGVKMKNIASLNSFERQAVKLQSLRRCCCRSS